MRVGTALGIGRKLTNPSSFSIPRNFIVPFSTSSNSSSGSGRGRGRGGPPPLFNFLAEQLQEQPNSDPPASLPGAGHGRGKPLSPPPPSSFSGSPGRGHFQPAAESRAEPPPSSVVGSRDRGQFQPTKQSRDEPPPSSVVGLGDRGQFQPTKQSRDEPPPSSVVGSGDIGQFQPTKESRAEPPRSFATEIEAGSFATRGQVQPATKWCATPEVGNDGFIREKAQMNLRASAINSVIMGMGGSGRGNLVSSSETQTMEENRQIGAMAKPKRESRKLKLTPEEAVRQALSVLQRGDGDGPADFGGGGRGRGGGGRGRGRGRGGRGRRDGEGETRREGVEDGGIASGLYLGDNADGEKLAKRLGPEVSNQLTEAFMEIGAQILPCPLEDAHVDAFDTNCKIEFEPEYLIGDLNQNPDIDEKPPMPLRDALEKMKPFLMAYEGIQSQEEWEEAMKEIMERVPLLKEIVDHYSGPDRVTAKTQHEELKRVAKSLPAKVPDSVKQFTDRAVLSLQSNPGWGFHRKCQFMDKLTEKVKKHYK